MTHEERLAEVLSVLVGTLPFRIGPDALVGASSVQWLHEPVAEALEALETHGMVPPQSDQRAFVDPCDSCVSECPSTHADLVAWAVLGSENIVAAETIARDWVDKYMCLAGWQFKRIEWVTMPLPRDVQTHAPLAWHHVRLLGSLIVDAREGRIVLAAPPVLGP